MNFTKNMPYKPCNNTTKMYRIFPSSQHVLYATLKSISSKSLSHTITGVISITVDSFFNRYIICTLFYLASFPQHHVWEIVFYCCIYQYITIWGINQVLIPKDWGKRIRQHANVYQRCIVGQTHVLFLAFVIMRDTLMNTHVQVFL